MAAQLFLLPFRPAINPNGLTVSGAQLYFYLTGTTTLTDAFSTAALDVALSNPVEANSAGVWPMIYLDDTVTYRVVLKDAEGATLDDADPYIPGIVDDLTAEMQELYDDTAAARDVAVAAAANLGEYETAFEDALSVLAAYPAIADPEGYLYDPVTMTRYKWATEDGAPVLAIAPTIWMDPVGGSDVASGLTEATAIKTFAALEAHAGWVDGATVAFKRPADGAVIRDGLYAPGADYRTIVSYGEGPLAILDGTEVAANASFTVNGTYGNCYDINWSHSLEGTVTTGLRVFEAGKPLKRRATLAEVTAEPGTYLYTGSIAPGVAMPVTIHPYGSTNAVTDGKVYEIIEREAALYLNNNCRIEGFHGRKCGNNDGAFRLHYDGRANLILSEEGTKHNYVFGDGIFSDVIAVNCIDEEHRPEGAACILGTSFVSNSAGRTYEYNRAGWIIDPSVYGNTISTGENDSTCFYSHDAGVSQFSLGTFNDCWMSKTKGMTPLVAEMVVNDFYFAAPSDTSAIAFAAYFPITLRGGVFVNCSRIVDGALPDAEGLVAFNETTSASGGLFSLFAPAVIAARIVNNLFLLSSALSENQTVAYFPATSAGSALTLTGNVFDGFRQTIYVDDVDTVVTAQNNVYRSHSGAAMIFDVDGVQKSFAQWQAFGYDSNGLEGNPQWQTGIKPTIAVPDVRLLAGGAGALRHAGEITMAYVQGVMDKPLTLAAAKTHLAAIAHTPVTSL